MNNLHPATATYIYSGYRLSFSLLTTGVDSFLSGLAKVPAMDEQLHEVPDHDATAHLPIWFRCRNG